MTAEPASYEEMVAQYRRRDDRPSGRVEPIDAPAGSLAYNPCLIAERGHTYLAVRLESPHSYWRDEATWDPTVRFFQRADRGWVAVPDMPVFTAAEDPYAVWVRDAGGNPVLVLVVVSLDFRSDPPTVVSRFFAASEIRHLSPREPFLEVRRMKDIRLLQLADALAVCGRPQGGTAGVGRVSFTTVGGYADLTPEAVEGAHIFADQVADQTKIGTNYLYDLGDRIGALGHVAVGSEGSQQRYAAAWWTIDPVGLTAGTPAVIAMREDFPAGPAKLPTLVDVVFPGSLEPLDGGRARLYCGLSDATTGSVVIPTPDWIS